MLYAPSDGENVDNGSRIPCACVTALTSCTKIQFGLSKLFLIDDKAETKRIM